MNKKGDSYHLGKEVNLWFPRIIIMVIVILIIFSFIGSHIKRNLDIDYLQSSILTEGLFYSPDCFTHRDENGMKIGVIDHAKFKEQTLNECIIPSKKLTGIGLKLTLVYGANKEIIYINKDAGIKFPSFCSDEKSFACFSKQFYVLVKDSSGIQKGVLKIDTIKSK